MNKQDRTDRYREIYELILSIDETQIKDLQTKVNALSDITTVDFSNEISEIENELNEFYIESIEEIKSEVETLLDDLRDYIDFSEPIGMHKQQVLSEIEFLENLDLENYTGFDELLLLNKRLKSEFKIDLGIIINEYDRKVLGQIKEIINLEEKINSLEKKSRLRGLHSEEFKELKEYKEKKEQLSKAFNEVYKKIVKNNGEDAERYINKYINKYINS